VLRLSELAKEVGISVPVLKMILVHPAVKRVLEHRNLLIQSGSEDSDACYFAKEAAYLLPKYIAGILIRIHQVRVNERFCRLADIPSLGCSLSIGEDYRYYYKEGDPLPRVVYLPMEREFSLSLYSVSELNGVSYPKLHNIIESNPKYWLSNSYMVYAWSRGRFVRLFCEEAADVLETFCVRSFIPNQTLVETEELTVSKNGDTFRITVSKEALESRKIVLEVV